MTDFKIDAKSVKKLANILVETELTEIEYHLGDAKIRVARTVVHNVQAPPVIAPSVESSPSPPSAEQNTEQHSEDAYEAVRSPMVGTAYLASDPGSPPFIQEGDEVKADQTLMIVEAMKVMNPIKAPCAGIVKKICVTNSKPVEFNETLVLIDRR